MISTTDPTRTSRRQVIVTVSAGVLGAALLGILVLVYGVTPMTFIAGAVVTVVAAVVGWLLGGESPSLRDARARTERTHAVIRESERLAERTRAAVDSRRTA